MTAVHDQIDIPSNTIGLKFGGGEGGHNGPRRAARAQQTFHSAQ
ncbi:hypothetical protein GM708_10255 [Vibrio cholerae]|nr:hypothetical protein [Vibrio cholerae]